MRALALVLAVVVAGCDFTPTLDIELPDHEPALVLNAVLAADSVVSAEVGLSFDPYRRATRPALPPGDATVTLLRDGAPVETLARTPCLYPGTTEEIPGCAKHVGRVPVRSGETYTLRAESAAYPTAEAAVTVPVPPSLAVEAVGSVDGERQFRIDLTDPAGGGDRYGVSLYRGPFQDSGVVCDPPEYTVCRDTTYARPRQAVSFTTSDPVILAAARQVPGDDGGIRFASVTDQTFDGRTWAFTLTERAFCDFYYGGGCQNTAPLTVQVAALSHDLYDAYLVDAFGAEDNPFTEPADRPSNVTGGYGLVGALALAEVTFEGEAATRRAQIRPGPAPRSRGGSGR